MGKYGFKVLNKKILKCFFPSFLTQTVQQQYNYLSLSLPFTCKWEVRTNVDWIQSFAFSSIDMMSFAKDISNASLLDLSVSSSLEVNRSMETNILLIDYVIRHIYSLIDGIQMDRLPMSVMKSAAPAPPPHPPWRPSPAWLSDSRRLWAGERSIRASSLGERDASGVRWMDGADLPGNAVRLPRRPAWDSGTLRSALGRSARTERVSGWAP